MEKQIFENQIKKVEKMLSNSKDGAIKEALTNHLIWLRTKLNSLEVA